MCVDGSKENSREGLGGGGGRLKLKKIKEYGWLLRWIGLSGTRRKKKERKTNSKTDRHQKSPETNKQERKEKEKEKNNMQTFELSHIQIASGLLLYIIIAKIKVKRRKI